MPLPPGYQMVTAASAGPGAPFTGVQCPDDGQKAAAADIRRVAATALANDNYIINDSTDGLVAKANKAGDTFTGAVTFDDSVEVNGNLDVNSTAVFGAYTTFNDPIEANDTAQFDGATTVNGTLNVTGRRAMLRSRVSVTDASQTIDVTQGDTFELPPNNAAPRTITLKSTSPAVPANGECLTFLWTPAGAGGAGTQYTFKREDLTVIATFDGSGVADTGAVFAEFEYAGSVWRLRTSSGSPWDGTVNYGVIPGAGA